MVLVTWHDAHAGSENWVHVDDLDDDGAYVVQSVGWLMEGMKRGHVTISQSSTQCGHVDAVLHVPLKMVKSVQLLAVGDMVQVGGRKR
jgi:hypothetical protein